jgi:hypothetical protein
MAEIRQHCVAAAVHCIRWQSETDDVLPLTEGEKVCGGVGLVTIQKMNSASTFLFRNSEGSKMFDPIERQVVVSVSAIRETYHVVVSNV